MRHHREVVEAAVEAAEADPVEAVDSVVQVEVLVPAVTVGPEAGKEPVAVAVAGNRRDRRSSTVEPECHSALRRRLHFRVRFG
jgi:hypothetical protein